MQPQPFEVDLSTEAYASLKSRLHDTRWPDLIGADDWIFGVPGQWLKEMVAYWREEWDWSTQAAAMNQWSHYRVEIDGIPIHYLHAPAPDPEAPALLLTHGWPWTFWDFKDVIGPLSNPAAYGAPAKAAFNVYVPSLPGFGFSTPLTQAGIDVARTAELWKSLMTEILGHSKFAAHGGDWGALVTAHMAHAHPDVLIGAHMSLTLIPGIDRALIGREAYAENEQWMIARNQEALPLITSHLAVHRHDPQTLAYALIDSPVGTAAWIWERRRQWSDCRGNIEDVFDRDHLCNTAALYWCTGAIASSLRLYHEHFKKPWPLVHTRRPVLEAPCGFAVFPKDVVHLPRATLAAQCNLKQYSLMPQGGHFGAAEQPELLVADLRQFFHDTLK